MKSRDVFQEIEVQREIAIENGQHGNTLDDFISKIQEGIDRSIQDYGNDISFTSSRLGRDINGNGIPIEYHTWATAIPAHHWLLGRRIVVYLPSPKGDISPEEYIVKRTGANTELLRELMNGGWIILKLDRNYSDEFTDFLKANLFYNNNGVFLYSQIVEEAIIARHAYLKKNYGIQSLSEYLKRAPMKISISSSKTTDLLFNILSSKWGSNQLYPTYNVKQNIEKVWENFTRLWLLTNSFNQSNNSIYLRTKGVMNTLEEKIERKKINDIAVASYTSFLFAGTESFYSLFSGNLSMGYRMVEPKSESAILQAQTIGMNGDYHERYQRKKILLDRNIFQTIMDHGKQILSWNDPKPGKGVQEDLGQVMEDISRLKEFYMTVNNDHDKLNDLKSFGTNGTSQIDLRNVNEERKNLLPEILTGITPFISSFSTSVEGLSKSGVGIVFGGIASLATGGILLKLYKNGRQIVLKSIDQEIGIGTKIKAHIASFPYV